MKTLVLLTAVIIMTGSVFAQDLNSLTTEQLQKQLLIEQIGLVRAQKAAVEQNSAMTGEIAKLVPVAKIVLPALFSQMADFAAKKEKGDYSKLYTLQMRDMAALFSECVKEQPDAQAILKLACQMYDRGNLMVGVRNIESVRAVAKEMKEREDAQALANPKAKPLGE